MQQLLVTGHGVTPTASDTGINTTHEGARDDRTKKESKVLRMLVWLHATALV